MGLTKIEWAYYTFNPWVGCVKVNAACKFCYAMRGNSLLWGPEANREVKDNDYWQKPISWNNTSAKNNEVRSVFCASLADVFELRPDLDGSFSDLNVLRERLWVTIENTPNLLWKLLTKRPENILKLLPDRWKQPNGMPRNLMLGVSTGNQEQFNSMWPIMESLMQDINVPTFISAGPLIGPIDMLPWFTNTDNSEPDKRVITRLPSEVIVEGESGLVEQEVRPMHPDWVVQIQEACTRADGDIKFHFKQWGEFTEIKSGIHYGNKDKIILLSNGDYGYTRRDGIVSALAHSVIDGKPIQSKYTKEEFKQLTPVELVRVGKYKAGRELNGKIYNDVFTIEPPQGSLFEAAMG